MRQSTFAVLSLLLLGPSLISAAPHESIHYEYDSTTAHRNHTPRPWRRLSDAIIRRIWGIPEKQKSLGAHNDYESIESGPEGKLLALYGEDVVIRFNISTAAEASALAEASDILFLDVWEFNENWVDIRIAKDVVPSLLGLLPASLQNSHVPLMQNLDLAQAIVDTYPPASVTQPHGHENGRGFSLSLSSDAPETQKHPFFKDYQPLSVITPWMNLMASMFRTHVRRINIGISYEGRDIPALRIGVHPTNNEKSSSPRKTILITGGSHAREWISTSTVNYLAWNLIKSYGKIPTITKMLQAFDFVFIPTLNPDGYAYTWETDRLWRKNRQPTSLRFCQGIDLDRTYPFKWDGDKTHSNPCSESFAGDVPFDGVEAQRFAEWAKNETENNNVEFLGFMDLHSYSQQILYPYSFTCDEEPPTVEVLEELALGLAKAIRISRKGHNYKVTSACEGNVAISKDGSKGGRTILPRIESNGGSALDWFYHELKVKYAYQIKLRDTGSYGFLLPKDNIIPTGEEVLDAVLYFGRFALGEVGLAAPDAELTHPGEFEDQDSKTSEIPPEGSAEPEERYETSVIELRRRR